MQYGTVHNMTLTHACIHTYCTTLLNIVYNTCTHTLYSTYVYTDNHYYTQVCTYIHTFYTCMQTHTHSVHTLFTHACTMHVCSACKHTLSQVGLLSQLGVLLPASITHLTVAMPDSVYSSLHVMLAVLLTGTWPDGTALPLAMVT